MKLYTTVVAYTDKDKNDVVQPGTCTAENDDEARGKAIVSVLSRKEQEPWIWGVDVYAITEDMLKEVYPHFVKDHPLLKRGGGLL